MKIPAFDTPRGLTGQSTSADRKVLESCSYTLLHMIGYERDDTCAQTVMRTYEEFPLVLHAGANDSESQRMRRIKRYALAYIGLSDQEMPE